MFDWDQANISHIAAHGITPAEAEFAVLNDAFDLDVQIRNGEERSIQFGQTASGRILVVVLTVRKHLTRIVTAYPAPRFQQDLYFKARGFK